MDDWGGKKICTDAQLAEAERDYNNWCNEKRRKGAKGEPLRKNELPPYKPEPRPMFDIDDVYNAMYTNHYYSNQPAKQFPFTFPDGTTVNNPKEYGAYSRKFRKLREVQRGLENLQIGETHSRKLGNIREVQGALGNLQIGEKRKRGEN